MRACFIRVVLPGVLFHLFSGVICLFAYFFPRLAKENLVTGNRCVLNEALPELLQYRLFYLQTLWPLIMVDLGILISKFCCYLPRQEANSINPEAWLCLGAHMNSYQFFHANSISCASKWSICASFSIINYKRESMLLFEDKVNTWLSVYYQLHLPSALNPGKGLFPHPTSSLAEVG